MIDGRREGANPESGRFRDWRAAACGASLAAMMEAGTSWYQVANVDEIASPALLVYPDRIEKNLDRMLETVGGDVDRLRPHVKTHKMAEVIERQRLRGIDRCKCATIAEAELAATAGVGDVLLAYQPVGPNIERLLALRERFPETRFQAVVDDAANLERLLGALANQAPGRSSLGIFVDLDCGMGRTGIAPGDEALALCRRLIEADEVEFGGIHAYDGHIHDPEVADRDARFVEARDRVTDFLERLTRQGIGVPKIVGGGSPTFPWHARLAGGESEIPYECSPGTTLLWDAGYGTHHPDLSFEVAAVLLSRVLSKPGEGRICLELGHKAVAAENPIENRVRFPDLPDAVPISQSEEHLVLETTRAASLEVGEAVYGIPWHICPTVALHQEAVVIREGRATGERWKVRARDRRITI